MFELHPELKRRYCAEACGQAASSLDPSEMLPLTQYLTHYIMVSQGKQKAEHQLRKPKDSGQRRLDDF
jgi:hypothetical protein